MIERPGFREAGRIIGLDLSKKHFTGCVLLKEEGFVKEHPINGDMDSTGQARFIMKLEEGDWVALEGGTSSSMFARNMLENSKAKAFMLNPAKLHIIFQTAVKTDRKDAVKTAQLLRDMDPVVLCQSKKEKNFIGIPGKFQNSCLSTWKALFSAKKQGFQISMERNFI